MADVPVRYDIGLDEFVPVTQEWVDMVQQKFNSVSRMLVAAAELHKGMANFLTIWEENYDK